MGSSKFINQEIRIYYIVYIVSVDHNGIAVHLTRVTVKCFKKCCICGAVDGADCDMLRHNREEDGNISSVCDGDEGTDCEDGDNDTNR